MRIVVASCSVIYTGRGDTKLPEGVRAVIIKDDGAISIHNDKSNKPLNYMGKGSTLTETHENGCTVWTFDTTKESLRVTLHKVISDTNFMLDTDDEGLIRDGTENQLQAWLAENPESLGPGFKFIQREHQTGAGAVDLLMEDGDGNPVAVEVKRTAMLGSVSQVMRYVDAMNDREGFENTRGIVAALDVRPKTQALADRRGIICVVLPAWWKETQKRPEDNTYALLANE